MSKLRVIQTDKNPGNSALSTLGNDALIINTGGGIYLGNESEYPIDLAPLKPHTHSGIPLHITLSSSATTNVGKYKKFAVIDCSSPWKDFECTFIINENEGNSFWGILQVFCRTSSTVDVFAVDMKWAVLSNPNYVLSVYAETSGDGYLTLYVRAVKTYQTTEITCLTNNTNITLEEGEWVDTIIAFRSSSLGGYVSGAKDSSLLNGQTADYYETTMEYII